MKKSDLKAYIKESIVNTLSEGYIGDKKLSDLPEMGTADMNLWHVVKLIDAGIIKDSDYKKALKALDPSRQLEEQENIPDADEVKATTKALADMNKELAKSNELRKEEEEDDKDAIRGAERAKGKNKKYDIVLKQFKEVEAEMRSLAREYSKADGVEKEELLKKLKDLTGRKNELKKEVDKYADGLV